MNPKNQYPEMEQMTHEDMFIESAWCKRGDEIIRMKPLKMIKKNERDDYARQMIEMFNADEVNLSYYSKDTIN